MDPKIDQPEQRKMSRLVLTQLSLRSGSVMETRRWVRNVGFTTCAMLGARQLDMGCTVREVGRETRILKSRERKRPRTSSVSSKSRVKRRMWRRESVPRPRKVTRSKSSRMEKVWAVVGPPVKL